MKLINRVLLLHLLFFGLAINVFAKEIKPQVLVYGDNIQAFAAAWQSARSGVPTLWVMPSENCCQELFSNTRSIATETSLVGGIWMNILQEVSLKKEKNDSLFTIIQQDLNPQGLSNALLKMMQDQKNLFILKNIKVVKLSKDKKSINIVLSNKKKLNLRAVVDATKEATLSSFIVGKPIAPQEAQHHKPFYGPISHVTKDAVRALIAIGTVEKQTYGLAMNEILAETTDNMFFTKKITDGNSQISIPFQFNMGQAVGAYAAYCAFFKTTADKVDVRKVQTELMTFESRILPFEDINVEDPNFNALQRIFLVNVLPWEPSAVPLQFNTSDSVSVASVRPVLQQLYSRAQLWFLDNEASYFKTKDLVELIKVVAFRGNELDGEIQKAWNKRFKLKGDFDLDHTITRYEFAVLMDAYAEPFAKRVTVDGVILR